MYLFFVTMVHVCVKFREKKHVCLRNKIKDNSVL
jgi:hypothetical protein